MGTITTGGAGGLGRLWVPFALSLVGDQVSRVGLTWYVWERTGSTTSLAVLSVCYGLPLVAGGLLAGPLIDRYGAARVMVWDNALRGAAMLAGALLAALGALTVPVACVLAACYGLLAMITLAGVPVLIAERLDPAARAAANARELIAFNTAGIVGPAIATFLLSAVGIAGVLLADAVTYMALALALVALRERRAGARADAARGPGAGNLGALRVIVAEPILRNITLMFMALNVGYAALVVFLPQIASTGPLPGLSDAETYATFITLVAVGEIASTAVLKVAPRQRIGLRICVSQALAGLAVLAIVAGHPLWTAAMLLLVGVTAGPLTVWAQTLRMAVIPAELRGRIFALLRLTMQSGAPIGAAAAGALAAFVSVSGLIALAGGLIALPGALGAASKALVRARTPEASATSD